VEGAKLLEQEKGWLGRKVRKGENQKNKESSNVKVNFRLIPRKIIGEVYFKNITVMFTSHTWT
jgi:hypothetical protein